MIRDVFYLNKKPNAHPRERFATSLADARHQSTTEHFWIITEFCDYKNFDWEWDFEFLPDEDVWAQDHDNVWPSQHQKDSGTWLCPRDHKGYIVYRADVDVVKRKNEINDQWKIFDNIDLTKFDFSWHPDPTDPPYIYHWGNKWISAEVAPTVEYTVDGATEVKYMTKLVQLNPKVIETELVDKTKFDLTWRPDPIEPPFIYRWGCKYFPVEEKHVLEYCVPGATEIKYMDQIIELLPEWNRWTEIEKVNFDLSWRPDPKEPAYIYRWGCKYFPVEEKHVLEYCVPSAHEIKYMNEVLELLPEWDRWKEYDLIDKSSFDFTWRPDFKEPPYIYRWGCKYFPVEEKHVLEYCVPGAHDIKYMDQIVELLPEWERWTIHHEIDKNSFDFSWRPDSKEPPYIYVFGNDKYSGEQMVTLEYHVPGATEIKYMDSIVKLTPEWDRWKEFELVDKVNFDFTWCPDPKEPPFIYRWGCKYFPVEEKHVLEYCVPSATEIKYMDEVVELLPEWDNWKEYIKVDKNKFDFSWRPDPREPAFIYVWGNKYIPGEIKSTIEYHVPGAIEKKYIGNADMLPEWDKWKEVELVDKTKFDFSWRPDPREPAYIYRWGCKYFPVEEKHVLEYCAPGATEIKYMDDIVELQPEWERWKLIHPVNKNKFDFTWRPDPKEPPYIYVFGNKQYSAEKMPTVEYHVLDATERKYIDDIKATLAPDMNNWQVPIDFDKDTFDFTWHPDPHSPPYIYQFGSIADKNDGPRYITLNNTGDIVYLDIGIQVKKYTIETTLDALVKQHSHEVFWATRKNINYQEFDFTWRPELIDSSWESTYVSVFGSVDSDMTQTYFVNAKAYLRGNTQFKFIETTELTEKTLSKLFIKPDMFFVDNFNQDANKRFEELKTRFPTIQRVRYLSSWVDTINRCVKKSTTELFWILDSNLDYTSVDFDYYPNPWQLKMIHVFGTQWSRWGTTFMINRETFPEDTKYVKIIEHLSMINFVKDRKAIATTCQHDIIFVDHGNKEADIVYQQLVNHANEKEITRIECDSSYLRTFKKLLSNLAAKKEHYIWVCSSICDYTNFDFTYIADPFAKDQLHVFPSDKQKFGDTFLIDVNKVREQLETITSLEDYEKINFNQTMRLTRLKAPSIIVHDDTHVNAIPDFDFPYITMTSCTDENIQTFDEEPMNLWSPKTKTITIMSEGATKVIVPREAKEYVKRELYDYPYIKKASRLVKSNPMDIVFLSNGEQGADENYEHLLQVTHKLPNRVIRVDGVNGRVQAYHAALEASNTPWAFTVFSKLEVNEKFDWSWQPDRMQVPKHYIFYAENPVNGLIYGHQAMIAYQKSLVLNNIGKGLDFTLDDEHEVVEQVSGIAQFNTDPFATWRTAFREVIKLKDATDHMSKQRLEVWLTKAEGNFAEYCLLGAKDASDYYDEVAGDFSKLKLSYEWAWLKARFDK